MAMFDGKSIANRLLGGARDIGKGVAAAAQVAGEGLDIMGQRRRANVDIPVALGQEIRGRQLSPEQERRPLIQEARKKEFEDRIGGMIPMVPGVAKPERIINLDQNFMKQMASALNQRAGTNIGPMEFAKGFYKLFGKTRISETELKSFLSEKLKNFHPNEIDDIIREITIPK